MNSKLTLRMDHGVIVLAKAEAAKRGKSVSQMVADFIDSIGQVNVPDGKLPPVTSSLLGLLRDHEGSEESYKKHLQDKYR